MNARTTRACGHRSSVLEARRAATRALANAGAKDAAEVEGALTRLSVTRSCYRTTCFHPSRATPSRHADETGRRPKRRADGPRSGCALGVGSGCRGAARAEVRPHEGDGRVPGGVCGVHAA